MNNKTFNLDLTKDVKTNPVVFGRIGDGGVQTVTVNISNQNVPVDLTGYTITFEGVTNSQKSKIFDSQGVKSTTDGLKKGTFDYVFPSAAFGVSGRYETAYFSFIKDSARDTTGQIDIIVSENADINAEEAQTIITEYNKLVAELQEKTDQYISDSDSKFTELNKKIADLQTKIDDYTSSVQTTANDAIQAVNDALAKLKAADFYTKEESDAKFFANKGNLASGTDLDNIIDIGTYRIGGLTGGTDIINVPSERSGTTIYAYLTVSGTTTSVVQELIVYDSKTVSQIYSRSRSGSTPTFSTWSKTVMADDSGKVTVKDLEVTGTITGRAKNILLSGAYWMQAGQVVTPSKAISDCENGWLLHFTEYKSGMDANTKNGQNHYYFVPKESAEIADVGTSFPLVESDGTVTLKYLYIQGTKITGNVANETTNSKKFVLQHVLEY